MEATCTVHNKILVNFSLKAKKKLPMVLSKIQVSNPGPSWPSCLLVFHTISFPNHINPVKTMVSFEKGINPETTPIIKPWKKNGQVRV